MSLSRETWSRLVLQNATWSGEKTQLPQAGVQGGFLRVGDLCGETRMRRRTTLPWEGRGKESSREGESKCRGPEVLGTGLHDRGAGRTLVWPQRSGWGRGEGWGARPSCRGRSAPASRFKNNRTLSAHLRLTAPYASHLSAR